MYYGSSTESQQVLSDDDGLRKRVISLVLEIKSNANLLRQIAELNEVHAMII